MGIEPTLAAWEAAVLPLNYTRLKARFYSGPRCVGKRTPVQLSAYRYSTNEATAPSSPCTFGLVDSIR
jgi:hypothetical protein